MSLVLDFERRQDDLDPLEGFRAQHLLVDREIAVGPRGKPARELVMADEGGGVVLEGRVAEHVVGMHVGIDHIADRLVGHGADRARAARAPATALPSVSITATRIAADDEAGIGHVAAILRRLHLVAALMHENRRARSRSPQRCRRRDAGSERHSGAAASVRAALEEILARDQLPAAHQIMLSLSARSSRRECIARSGKRCESPKYRYRSRGFGPRLSQGSGVYDAFAPDAAQKSRGDSLAPALLVFITFVYVTAAGIGRVFECGFFLS